MAFAGLLRLAVAAAVAFDAVDVVVAVATRPFSKICNICRRMNPQAE
jgi:hypothetical protein